MENLHLKNLDLTKINKKMKNNKVKRKVIQKTYDDVVESKSSKRDKRQKIIRNVIFIKKTPEKTRYFNAEMNRV